MPEKERKKEMSLYTKVNTDLNFVEREHEVEKFWEDRKIFEKSMKIREGSPTYTFYDGPPTANGKPHIGHIITLLMADLNKRLVDKEITVELTDTAKQFITDNGYDPVYGARPLKRYLQKHVETLAAKLILADGVRAGDTILIDVKDGKLSASAVQKNA